MIHDVIHMLFYLVWMIESLTKIRLIEIHSKLKNLALEKVCVVRMAQRRIRFIS